MRVFPESTEGCATIVDLIAGAHKTHDPFCVGTHPCSSHVARHPRTRVSSHLFSLNKLLRVPEADLDAGSPGRA